MKILTPNEVRDIEARTEGTFDDCPRLPPSRSEVTNLIATIRAAWEEIDRLRAENKMLWDGADALKNLAQASLNEGRVLRGESAPHGIERDQVVAVTAKYFASDLARYYAALGKEEGK